MAKRPAEGRLSKPAADAIQAAEAAWRVGDNAMALRALLTASRAEPEARALYPPLARALEPMRFTDASPAVAEGMERTLRAPEVDPQPLAAAAISLAKATHRLKQRGRNAIDASLAQDPLLLTLLGRALLPDAEFEGMLVQARRFLLKAAGTMRPKPRRSSSLRRWPGRRC
mgnify:CR=1 FL=1